MKSKIISQLALVSLLASLLVPFALSPRTADALKDPCALDPNNLIINGSMAPSHDTQYGSLAESWDPFIFDGTPPHYQWVGNEQIDPNGSQQIVSTNAFDAGIYQTVHNLQPNVYYWFRLGYSLAAKSYSGPNVRVDSIGRKVGVDPFGGNDPKSPNVIWGPDLFDGNAALNRSEMTMIFAARSPNATVFLRAMARDGSGGENRVWLDAMCMEAKPEMATATPAAPTVTPLPPTATPKPVQPRAPVTAPPTKVAQAPSTPTAVPATPTPNDTPTPAFTPTIPSTPRRARGDVTPAAALPIDVGTGVATGGGVLFMVGGLVFFGIGILLLKRTN